jgi:hypothetical protein
MHEARAMKTRSVSDKHAFRMMMNIAGNVRYIRMKHSLRSEPKHGIYIFVRKFCFLVKKKNTTYNNKRDDFKCVFQCTPMNRY